MGKSHFWFVITVFELIIHTLQQKSSELWLGSLPTIRVLRGDLYYYDLGKITNVSEPVYSAIEASPAVIRIKTALDDHGLTTNFSHLGCDQFVSGPGPYRFILLCNQTKLVSIQIHPETRAVSTIDTLTSLMPKATRCTKMFSESERKDNSNDQIPDYGNRIHLLCVKSLDSQNKLTIVSLMKNSIEFASELDVDGLMGEQTEIDQFDFTGGLIVNQTNQVVSLMIFRANPDQISCDPTWYLVQSDPNSVDKYTLAKVKRYSQQTNTITACGVSATLHLTFHSVFYSRFENSQSGFYLARSSSTGDMYVTKLIGNYKEGSVLPETFSCQLQNDQLDNNGKITEGLQSQSKKVSLKLFEDIYGGCNALLIWTPQMIKQGLLTASVSFRNDKSSIDISKFLLQSVNDVFVLNKIVYILGVDKNQQHLLISSKEIQDTKSGNFTNRMDQTLELGRDMNFGFVFSDDIDANKQAFAVVSDKNITVGKIAYNMLRANMASNDPKVVEHTYKINLHGARNPEISANTSTIEYQIVPDISHIRSDDVPRRIDLYTSTQSYQLAARSASLSKLIGTLSVQENPDLKISFKIPSPQPIKIATEGEIQVSRIIRVGDDLAAMVSHDTITFIRCGTTRNDRSKLIIESCQSLFSTKILDDEIISFNVLAAIQSSESILLMTEESDINARKIHKIRLYLDLKGVQLTKKVFQDMRFESITGKAPKHSKTIILYAILGAVGQDHANRVAWLEVDSGMNWISDWVVALTLPNHVCAKTISAKIDSASSGIFDIVSQCDPSTKIQQRVYSWNIPMMSESTNSSLLVNSLTLFPPNQIDGSIPKLHYCSFGAGVLLVFSGNSSTEGFNSRFTDPFGFNLARMVYGLKYYDIKDVLQLECLPEVSLANLLVKTKTGKTLLIGLDFFESGRIFDRISYAFGLDSRITKVYSVLGQSNSESDQLRLVDIVLFSQSEETQTIFDLGATKSIAPSKDYYKVFLNTSDSVPGSGTFEINYEYLDGVKEQQKVAFEVHEKQTSISAKEINKVKLQIDQSGKYKPINLENVMNLSGDYLNARLVGLDQNSTEMKSIELIDRYMQTDILNSSLYTFSKFMAFKSYILAPVPGEYLYLFKGNRVVASKRCKSSNMKMIIQDDIPTFFASVNTLEPVTDPIDGVGSKIAIFTYASQDASGQEDWEIIEYPLPFTSVRTLKVSSWGKKNQFAYSLTTQDNLNKSKIYVGVLNVQTEKGNMKSVPLYDQIEISFGYPINDYMMIPTHNGSVILTVSTQFRSSLNVIIVKPDSTSKSLTWWADSYPAISGLTANIVTLGCTGLGQNINSMAWNEKHYLCTVVPEGSAVFYTLNISLNLQVSEANSLVENINICHKLKALDNFSPVYATTERQTIIFYSKNTLPESARPSSGIYKEDMIVQVYNMIEDTNTRKVICSQTLQQRDNVQNVKYLESSRQMLEEERSENRSNNKAEYRVVPEDNDFPSRVFFNSTDSNRADYMAIPYSSPTTFSNGILTFAETNLTLKILSDEYLDILIDKLSIEFTDVNYRTVRVPLKDVIIWNSKSKYLTLFAYIVAGLAVLLAGAVSCLGWKMMKVKTASTNLKSESAGTMSYQSSFHNASDVYYVSSAEERNDKIRKAAAQRTTHHDDSYILTGKINEEL